MTTETEITAWLATQQDAMIALLREMVDIDSGSYNKPGIDAVGAVVQRFMAAQGIPVEVAPPAEARRLPARRGAVGRPAGNAGGNVVLMGHRDTVFPDGEVARRPFTIRDGIAYGPGVADMKAGLVMNCFVLAAFAKFGGSPAPLVGLFTGDEEIGSPEGRAVIEAEARRARVVFNSEPGRVSGNVVTGRKGGVFMAFRITGKAAHSGGNFTEGISAIEELARKIQAIHALTDLDRGITLNVGLVSGGQSVNTVAPWAEGQIDLRYVDPPDRDDAMAHIAAIIERSFVPGTKAELTITRRIPAAGADADSEAAVRDLRAVRRGHRVHDRGRVHRRLRRFRLHRRGWRADDLRSGPGGRQGAQPGRVPAHRQPGAARASLRPGYPAAGTGGTVTADQRCQSPPPCQPQPPPNATCVRRNTEPHNIRHYSRSPGTPGKPRSRLARWLRREPRSSAIHDFETSC